MYKRLLLFKDGDDHILCLHVFTMWKMCRLLLYPSFACFLGIEKLRQCCATWLLLEQFLLRRHNWKVSLFMFYHCCEDLNNLHLHCHLT